MPHVKRPIAIQAKHKNKNGFTLIELLAVLAIVAILFAILVPAISRVRNKAEASTCLANLRQVGMTIRIYAQDNNGHLPGPLYGGQSPRFSINGPTGTGMLAKILHPYLMSTESIDNSTDDVFSTHMACAGWQDAISSNNAPSLLLNARPWAVSDNKWDLFPFGDQNNPNHPKRGQPRTLTALNRYDLANTWALVEIDKSLLAEMNYSAGWDNVIPPNPVHGDIRNIIYYDLHAEVDEVNNSRLIHSRNSQQ